MDSLQTAEIMNWATWVLGTPSLHAILEGFLCRIYDEHHQDGITIYADRRTGLSTRSMSALRPHAG